VGAQGRPVAADLARTLYEQLITVDKVDYHGPVTRRRHSLGDGVAQRYNKVAHPPYLRHAHLAKYEMQFPAGGLAGDPDNTIPSSCSTCSRVRNAAEVGGSRHQQIPSVHFISLGAGEAQRSADFAKRFLEWISATAISAPSPRG